MAQPSSVRLTESEVSRSPSNHHHHLEFGIDGMPSLQIVGVLIGGLVAAQLAVYVASTVIRLKNAGRQQQLARELLKERVAAASALRQQREQAQLFWNGYRKFKVHKKVLEAQDLCSFHLVPHDRKELPQFVPGQYLTFKLPVAGYDKPAIRCYSLSDAPRPDHYRVTIKRIPPPPDNPDAPPGLASNHFHDHVHEGDILDVQAPRGNFVLHQEEPRPSVLIGGGVGITPFLSMIAAIAESGIERETYLFYGVRNRQEHAQRDYLRQLGDDHDHLHVYACYSHPTDEDVEGEDYHFAERISVDLLQRVLGTLNYDFYICGPPPMMKSLISGLQEKSVPKDHIFTEAFGPASGKAISKPRAEDKQRSATAVKVKFSRSGKECDWDDSYANLLEFAEAHGVDIDFGCRAGNCGTCEVAVKKGQYTSLTDHGADLDEGSCLTCISVPEGELELDA